MKILCKNKYWSLNRKYKIDKMLYLLVDRPNHINSYNEYVWKNKKGNIHRNYDLPAMIYSDGDFEWYKNNTFLKSTLCYYL